MNGTRFVHFVINTSLISTWLTISTFVGARAAEISYEATNIAQPPAWSESLNVHQFDPNIGTLQAVEITFVGQVEGTASYENLDTFPVVASLDLQAEITLQRPDQSVLATVNPLISLQEELSEFDGVTDFDGSSGSSNTGLLQEQSTLITLTTPADLALFSGTGNLGLSVSSQDLSNFYTERATLVDASLLSLAKITVRYLYLTAPEDQGTTQPVGGQGCTPGYWKQSQHFGNWIGYIQTNAFNTTFGVTSSFSPKYTLLKALGTNGGGEQALARHAVAALLNSNNTNVQYAYTQANVMAMVQNAYATGNFEATKNLLATENERGCPLNRAPVSSANQSGIDAAETLDEALGLQSVSKLFLPIAKR